MNIKINDWVVKVHKTAVEHGWWDRPREVPEVLCLMHSEIDEAACAYRDKEPMVWVGEGGKPEGVAVELIDCVIRAFDYVGFTGCEEFDDFLMKAVNAGKDVKGLDFYELLSLMHEALTYALEVYRKGDELEVLEGIAECCNWIFAYCAREDICIQTVLADKHAYNESRPYRHGGKKA